MIHSVMIFNNHGKARLLRFYRSTTVEAQQEMMKETFQLVIKRPDSVCNFLEGGRVVGGKDVKVIYRHYATLYFVFVVDSSESELGILDLIQVFVETLDRYFENVCELDIIFNTEKVHAVLDEIVMGGMVVETNIQEITAAIDGQARAEKAELGAVPQMFAPNRAMTTTARQR